jgi:Tol biopolymer transport system component
VRFRRRLAVFGALGAAMLLAAALFLAPETPRGGVGASADVSGPVPGVAGRWLYITYDVSGRSMFRTLEPSTKAVKDVVVFPPGSYAGGPTVSRDGSVVAYSVYRTGTPGTPEPGGSDLFVMEASGANPRMVLAHDAPGVSVAQPAWSADGRAMYFVRAAPDGTIRIERLLLAGARRQPVISDADNPTASIRGRLAFLRTDVKTYTQALWISQLDGRGARALVDHPAFLAMASPRFSPDGARIAFAAAHDPTMTPSRRSDDLRNTPHPLLVGLSGLLGGHGPSVAWAHGLPMDIWIVSADGRGLQQLTQLGEDDPVPAWSPDGRWLAFTGAAGLYLLDPDRREVKLLHLDGGGAGLTWLR